MQGCPRLVALFVVGLPFALIPYRYQLPNLTFSPRGLIHSNEILPLFFAPLAPPTALSTGLARLVQGVIVVRTQPPLPPLYAFTFALYLLRTIIGFVLTRSVGWAYPSLFSHWALYEATFGLGPAIVGLGIYQGVGISGHWVVGVLIVLFCVLEQAPWTYTTAILLGLSIRCILALSDRRGYLPLPNTSPDLPLEKGTVYKENDNSSPPLRYIILASIVFLPYFFAPAARSAAPENISLDIIILSFPRPVDVSISAEMLTRTIDSYAPNLSQNTSLSVFTHSTSHPAFDQVKESRPEMTFYTDDDIHPDDVDGHYLHLAEVFRWAEQREREWMMLVEDDFPLCEGRWDVVETVLYELEQRRERGVIRAGFIGTGGRSYLPLLSLLLRTHSAQNSQLPPTTRRRAPDELIQDCILGRKGSLCEREDGGTTIISSRLILDHIGGMATTTPGKAPNEDKWRCGWRHAFHGDPQVDVVVV